MNHTSTQVPQPVAVNGQQTEPRNHSYQQYYQRVIDQQLPLDNFGGLKLVVGPTGMGKTSAIPAVIGHLRAAQVDKRCIYTTHRHLLIEEMATELKKANIPIVYLKNNAEVVEEFLSWQKKGAFLSRLEDLDFFKSAESSRALVEKQIESLLKEQGNLQQLKNSDFHTAYKQQRQAFQERCSQLLHVFKNGLLPEKLSNEAHDQLMQDDGIWMLFPYVEFLRNPTRPTLLVTVQKLLYGFYNGRGNERILSLEDNIIFLDEFDMQEKELLDFLCRSP